ncbi:Nicotinate phosphoribosyltransferase [Dissostichus eleginoides]|uniref:Nicotinate phosphoribosyltransferase n=1 Tax=Dissostichus eleginoides TaxID=100907 RepID=A0AAD9FD20_DISEL|nr:Nicotinate phosphoribosyltransferase [Dissostichus eleginoides]
MDNLDHNPTATTAMTSFHGTSILVFQHPIKDYKGEERGQLKFGEDKVKVIPELPDSFTNIRPAFFTKKYPVPPKSNVTEDIVTGPDNSLHMSQLALEYEWLEKVAVTDGPVDVTWSAHHASKKRHPTFEVGITSLLPLLRDQAHSVATVRHVMDKIKDIVAFLNPGLGRVTNKGKIPSNWQSFLRDNDNKTELFHYLADKIAQMSAQNVVIVTKEENALSTQTMSLDELAPCSHEEANTRIFVHAKQAAKEGRKNIIIKANNTDILGIAVSILPTLQEIGLQQLWIAFGHQRNLKWIPVHDLCLSIGMEKSKGILFFHAFTGCDVVSAFRGKGKKTAWQTWEVCDEASDLFSKLSQYPPTVVYDDELKILETFVVMMYDRACS